MDRNDYLRRMAIIRSIRSFFDTEDFLEVESPVLAAACIPESTIPLFSTVQDHPWQGKRNLQLLPSPEYYLKQLLADGWGSLYQIARAFRNGENTGHIHAAEFSMLEYYGVGMDYMDSIELTERLFESIIRLPGLSDLPRLPFDRISMEEAFERFARLDLAELCGDDSDEPSEDDRARMLELCRHTGLVTDDSGEDWESLFNRVFLNFVEPKLESETRPLVLYDYPRKLQSLSKAEDGSLWSQRWELYWRGIELANCFTEENDQRRVEKFFRHELQVITRFGARQASPDPKFPAVAAALPLCSGTALGLDRLIMLLMGETRIDRVLPFPLPEF